MESMGDRIRRLREARGWSQDELADRLTRLLKQHGSTDTVSGAAVSGWELGGIKNIKNMTFYFLCQELDATPEYLLFGPRGPGERGANGRYGRRRPAASNGNTD